MLYSVSRNASLTSIKDSKLYLILFILWPFLAFFTALINYDQKEARKVVYFFFIYYGLTFIIYSGGYVDAAGYALELKENAQLPFSDFFKILGGLNSDETSVDIVEPFISFLVSRFTEKHNLLFAAYAAIFGWFYLKSINILYGQYRTNPCWNTSIHLAFFSLILPITAINGFRMWTAAWLFFFGAYHVILHRDIRYFLLTLIAPLIHFSFISVNILLLIYFLIGNRNLVYIPVAIASFIVPQYVAPFFKAISFKLGGALQSRFDTYSNVDYLLSRQAAMEEAAWFLQLKNSLIFYYLLATIIIIQVWFKKSMEDRASRNLLSFLILFLAFVNFGKTIPSFGARFEILLFLFATYYVFRFYLKVPDKKISFMTIAGLFPILLHVMVAFRQGSESINAWILSPVFGMPLLNGPVSLMEIFFQ